MSPLFIKSLNRVFRAEEGIMARNHASKSPLETANCVRGSCRPQNDNQDRYSLLRIAALAVLPFSIASVAVHAQPPAPLPVEPTVVHGIATIDTAGGHMTVTNSPNAIINWQDFSIGAEQGVHFNQLDATSQVLNRVIGDDPSQILGGLSSNGGVWLINPHGVLFGENARIDVAGLVTSTLDISNIDFMAGKYNFLSGAASPGQVTNQGHIHTTFGGRVWLIGGQVRNEGLIQTPGGNTVLAAGKSVELIDSGAPNVVVRVSAPENEVVNLGSLVAPGGSVDVHGSIVNQGGIIRADSVGAGSSGRIALTASQGLTLAGASVTGASGGNVTMTGGKSTYLAGLVDVSRQQGAGGNIQLNTGILEGMASGSLRADGEQGGHIRVEGGGAAGFSSRFSATGSIQGGTIDVTAASLYLLSAQVDASGGAQGGVIHLGGGWQGGGSLPHAREVLIGVGSEIKANAGINGDISGKGGEVAVWSTHSSQHYGLLQALNGGRIELSSQGEIRQTGALQAGLGGTVLFDPKNIVITDNPPDSVTVAQNFLGSTVGAGPGDEFGSAISLDGDRLAVGAPRTSGGDAPTPGAVYLFTGAGPSSSGLALQTTLGSSTANELGITGLSNGDRFGGAVALNGDLLVVGAPYTDGSEFLTDSGAIYIFDGVTSGQLHQQQKFEASESFPLQSGDHFGYGVALSDQGRLVVGANGVANKGAVYLFSSDDGFQTISQQGMLLSPSTADNGFFGRAVALEGDRLVVGAPGENGNRGSVYLYTANFSDFANSVSLQPKLSLSTATNAFFGISVSLDGEHMAVGASGENFEGDNPKTAAGSVYIYSGVGPDLSLPNSPQKIDANDVTELEAGDRFGDGVSLDGDRLAVGLRGRGSDTGAAYLLSGISSFGDSVNSATFLNNPSGDSYITPAALTTLLNAGTGVILQANNDITVSSTIPVSSDNESGRGGNFTLQAGRNVAINASITTDNGNFTAIAGDPAANVSFRDPGTPTMTIGEGGSLNVGSGTATLAALGGNFINNAGNQAILTTGAGRWLIYTGEPGNANFGGLASGNLALWNYRYPQNPPATITGNRYLFDTDQPQSLTFSTSGGSLTKTYGEDVTSLLPNPTVTGANSNTYGGAIIADNSVPLSELFEGVAAVSSEGAQATANVSGSPYDIIVAAGTLSSLTGYGMEFDSTGTITVTPATLTYEADPAIRLAGLPVSGLTGTVTGFVEGDNQQADTSGVLIWTTPATTASPEGAYAINGGGLSAMNYTFQQAESNATALTLREGINNAANNPPFKQNTLDTSVQSINTAIYGSFPVLNPVTTGFVIDLAAMKAPQFGRLDLSRMSRDEMRQLIEERREFKEKLFADAIYKLELDPSLANVPLCRSLADADTGLCRLTDAQRLAQASKVTQEEPSRIHRKTKVARLPQIERKFVVLFGTDQYVDTNIPPLENAIFDAETVGKLFADKLGYEVKVVKNATKADMVRTLNQLSTEMQPHDSVIIYYAGHGYRNEKTGGGYWIPADASVTDPTTWISNTDVSSMMSDISAKQMVMIADSCYSGTFAEQKLGMAGTGIKPDEVLAKRSVIVMSSGGDEPVADEGKEGHSIFAWDLMQALDDVDNWQPGTTIFEQVKREVMKSFPQTPQYGAVKSAGHEAGGEYLFEFRQLE
ncbi:filamentous hemagglutinin family N-terminal domain-containing protein [Nitrosospira briensis]|uniref:Filamentous hemagglutinin family N-terminal domain-containing protein n=2 Tax=Nitrosospira briensis TaxID=35799 RepID=A0A1I5CN89_9PROT|nr:filamentous hemagglutinin family N-terminal domain-containing protein [Nitrosospira briensis]